MPEKLEYYQNIVAEDMGKDEAINEMRAKIDDMYNCAWTAPKKLRDKGWWRDFVSTAPHDALDAPTRVLSTVLPHVDILPNNASPGETERVEKIERALLWHFDLSNRRSTSGRPLWEIVHHALRYSGVAFEVVYLPYFLQDQKGPRFKAIQQAGDFVIRVHNPQCVHARHSDYGLESVSLVTKRKAYDILKEFGEENPGVKKMMAELGEDLQVALRTQSVVLYDYTDWVDRVQWISFSENDGVCGGGDAIELRREEHKRPFIPWVVRQEDHPLLKPVVDANLWENANILRSLQYAQVIATAAQPRIKTITPSGEGVEIEFDDPGGQVQLRVGEDAQIFPPAMLDPHLTQLSSQADSDMFQTTASRILGSIEQVAGASTPFATVNAMLQTAVGQLGRYQRLAETALEDMFYLMLRWLDYAKKPLIAYESMNRNEDVVRGAQVMLLPASIGDDDDWGAVAFDPDNLHIKVTLQSDTATDKQARLNQAILMAERLPFDAEDALELHGFEYTDANKSKWAQGLLERANVEGMAREVAAQYELKIQQLQMQIQMQAQQQQMQAQQQMTAQAQAQQMNSEAAMSGMQGVDTRFGGAQAAPSSAITREGVTRQTQGGEELAL